MFAVASMSCLFTPESENDYWNSFSDFLSESPHSASWADEEINVYLDAEDDIADELR